jgi:hypothetical protein
MRSPLKAIMLITAGTTTLAAHVAGLTSTILSGRCAENALAANTYEPETWPLLGVACCVLLAFARRRRPARR